MSTCRVRSCIHSTPAGDIGCRVIDRTVSGKVRIHPYKQHEIVEWIALVERSTPPIPRCPGYSKRDNREDVIYTVGGKR